jgi:ribosome-binding protein aMBF1 (putative translation factor)
MKRLSVVRRSRGWSKNELARKASLHPAPVGQIESGRFLPYAVQLDRLARALEWPVGEADKLLEEVEVGGGFYEEL